jgi:hypothetical protein
VEQNITVRVANSGDVHYAETITTEMEASAKARGTGIAKRSPEYIANKMNEGKAVIAHLNDGTWVGFCYIETWEGEYVANSGLIVAPAFRKSGVAKANQEKDLQSFTRKISQRKNIWLNNRSCSDEDQQ